MCQSFSGRFVSWWRLDFGLSRCLQPRFISQPPAGSSATDFFWASLWSLPLPWLAAELGWIVSEYGRQPWAIEGVLPTFLGVSGTDAHNVLASLLGFILFYSSLALADLYLMV